MTTNDHLGRHGEYVLQALLTKPCYGRFFFSAIFMGEKHPTSDVLLELVNPTGIVGNLQVQVKTTRTGYTGTGAARKLNVDITAEDVSRLKLRAGPAYVAGVDANLMKGYIGGITSSTTGGIMASRHAIRSTA